MPRFEASIAIVRPPEAVFGFLMRPLNAVDVTPPETALTLLEAPELLYEGCRIAFEIKAYGQTQRFVHEVVELDPPRRFLEVQREGLFREFRHEHVVESAGADCCVLIDRVEFEPPGGLLGFLLTEGRISEMLAGSFEHRHREIKRLVEQAGP
ncbi:MAG TPA: SRPBCC family protein [Planctomycetaceae bacterium]|nr:SRPBCC family protein [Planctomycetaceae bacterium]